MFRFHDIPADAPTAAGLHLASLNHAALAIKVAWSAWWNGFSQSGLAAPIYLVGGTLRLSRALFFDTRRAMPLSACKSFLDLYLAIEFGELGSKLYIGGLSQHHRRIVAEVVSNAASISAAQRCGYQFFANRRDLNALITDCWIKPWEGKGPDFLMSGPNGSAFIEIKGSTYDFSLSLAGFAQDKAQSVNAELRPFGGRMSTRHILSQVFAPPGKPLSVHWFNADERHNNDVQPEIDAVLLVATGLAQFVGQMRNAGYDATALLSGTFVLPPEARKGHGYFLAPAMDGEFRIGVSFAALRLFVDISRYFLRLRTPGTEFGRQQGLHAVKLANRLQGLQSFFKTRKAAWRRLGEKPIHTFATGIFLQGPRER